MICDGRVINILVSDRRIKYTLVSDGRIIYNIILVSGRNIKIFLADVYKICLCLKVIQSAPLATWVDTVHIPLWKIMINFACINGMCIGHGSAYVKIMKMRSEYICK